MPRTDLKTTAILLIATSLAACTSKVPVERAAAPVVMSCRGVVDDGGRVSSSGRVHWEEVRDPRERERLDRSCGAVGPAVIGGPSTPPATMRAALTDVAFVSWNMHADAGELRALVNSIRTGGLDGAARPHVVVLLQEAFRAGTHVPARIPAGAAIPRAVRTRAGPRDDIVAAARALGMHLVYLPSMRNGRDDGPAGAEDRGNAIVSTLPLSDVAAIELPMARHRRVAIAATIAGETEAGAWRARVVSVHLDTVGRWTTLVLFSSNLRSRQAARLIESLHDRDLVVVGADANSWSEGPGEPAVDRLRQALPDTPAPRWQPTFQGLWRLDYLFFRLPDPWRVLSRRADRTFGSDHHAVIGGVVGPAALNSAGERPK